MKNFLSIFLITVVVILSSCKNKDNSALQRVYSNQAIKIVAVDGTLNFDQSGHLFKNIRSGFTYFGLDDPRTQHATKETVVEVYEITKRYDFEIVPEPLNTNIENLCLTQHQIVEFCKNNKEFLNVNPNMETVFFLKSDFGQNFYNHYTVIVTMHDDGLHILVTPLTLTYGFSIGSYFVIPAM